MADTSHLNALETGAYLLLLMMAWRTAGCGLPNDDYRLGKWARVDARTWSRIKPRVMEFWTLEEGGWKQKRLTKEYAIVSKRAEVARENGKHGGRPNSLKMNGHANPPGLPSDTQPKAPNPNPSKKEEGETSSPSCPKRKRVRTPYPEDFENFWSAYPTDALMSKKETLTAWQRLSAEDQADAVTSIQGFKAYCAAQPDYRPVHACRYLSQRRFEGFLSLARKGTSQVFIVQDTPEWHAWQQVRKTPVTENRELRGARGWWFEAKWPPEYRLEAAE
jgi:uncharacterized protein YdaU (DUF1376 family)